MKTTSNVSTNQITCKEIINFLHSFAEEIGSNVSFLTSVSMEKFIPAYLFFINSIKNNNAKISEKKILLINYLEHFKKDPILSLSLNLKTLDAISEDIVNDGNLFLAQLSSEDIQLIKLTLEQIKTNIDSDKQPSKALPIIKLQAGVSSLGKEEIEQFISMSMTLRDLAENYFEMASDLISKDNFQQAILNLWLAKNALKNIPRGERTPEDDFYLLSLKKCLADSYQTLGVQAEEINDFSNAIFNYQNAIKIRKKIIGSLEIDEEKADQFEKLAFCMRNSVNTILEQNKLLIRNPISDNNNPTVRYNQIITNFYQALLFLKKIDNEIPPNTIKEEDKQQDKTQKLSCLDGLAYAYCTKALAIYKINKTDLQAPITNIRKGIEILNNILAQRPNDQNINSKLRIHLQKLNLFEALANQQSSSNQARLFNPVNTRLHVNQIPEKNSENADMQISQNGFTQEKRC